MIKRVFIASIFVTLLSGCNSEKVQISISKNQDSLSLFLTNNTRDRICYDSLDLYAINVIYEGSIERYIDGYIKPEIITIRSGETEEIAQFPYYVIEQEKIKTGVLSWTFRLLDCRINNLSDYERTSPNFLKKYTAEKIEFTTKF